MTPFCNDPQPFSGCAVGPVLVRAKLLAAVPHLSLAKVKTKSELGMHFGFAEDLEETKCT